VRQLSFHPTEPGTFLTLSAGQVTLWTAAAAPGGGPLVRAQALDTAGAAVGCASWSADGLLCCCCADGRVLLAELGAAGLQAQLLLELPQPAVCAAAAPGLLALAGEGQPGVAVFSVARQPGGSGWRAEPLASFEAGAGQVGTAGKGPGGARAALTVLQRGRGERRGGGGGVWGGGEWEGGRGTAAGQPPPPLWYLLGLAAAPLGARRGPSWAPFSLWPLESTRLAPAGS
jgi:hypothetical protein